MRKTSESNEIGQKLKSKIIQNPKSNIQNQFDRCVKTFEKSGIKTGEGRRQTHEGTKMPNVDSQD